MTELLVINPNTSPDVTRSIERLAAAELGAGVRLRSLTAGFGARYINSRVGVAIAGHAVLDAYATALATGATPDAIIIACFGDPGLDALRELSEVPVFGFADSGMSAAAAQPGPFAIATFGAAWKDMLTELVERRKLLGRFAGFIELANQDRVAVAAAQVISEGAAASGAVRVIVGGTGLIPMMPEIVRLLPGLVLDPHTTTFRLAASSAERRSAARQLSSFEGLSSALGALLRSAGGTAISLT